VVIGNEYEGAFAGDEGLETTIERLMEDDMGETCVSACSNASAAPFTADDGAIEWKCLDSLRAIQMKGAPDIVAKVVRFYLGNSHELLESLGRAVSAHDASVVRTAAHTLKSSSANVGALGLAGLCARMEEMGRTGETSTAEELLARKREAHKSVCVRLAEELRRTETR
jgi:HPt (histidine-containing phosphotransfer) domain-containing protein